MWELPGITRDQATFFPQTPLHPPTEPHGFHLLHRSNSATKTEQPWFFAETDGSGLIGQQIPSPFTIEIELTSVQRFPCSRRAFFALPAFQHMVLRKGQRIPIAIERLFGQIGWLPHQRTNRLGCLDQKGWGPSGQFMLTQCHAVGPEAIATQGRGFRCVRITQFVLHIVLGKLPNSPLEIAIPCRSTAGRKYTDKSPCPHPCQPNTMTAILTQHTPPQFHRTIYATPAVSFSATTEQTGVD